MELPDNVHSRCLEGWKGSQSSDGMYGSGLNTGAAYMARRGWDKTPDSQGSISFHGSSRKKIFVMIALGILGFLLIAAIVIIILFAVGVINKRDVTLPESSTQSIIGQQLALNMMSAAVTDSILQSALNSRGPTVTVMDLTNSGEDLQVDFTLLLNNPLDPPQVAAVLRTQTRTIESQLGGNVQIDPTSIQVAG